jgi:hypothetical protein
MDKATIIIAIIFVILIISLFVVTILFKNSKKKNILNTNVTTSKSIINITNITAIIIVTPSIIISS